MLEQSAMRVTRPAGVVMLLAATLLSLFVSAEQAYAGRSICRTDPIVTLSNGIVVTLYADIEADLEDVAAVEYFLHIPRGVTVISVVHPDPLPASLESFAYADDGDNRDLVATTRARLLNGSKTKVIAYMDVQLPGSSRLRSDDSNGDTNKWIETEVRIRK